MDIREVGASPDLADNTDLIQKAIDSADHDEIVCIPDGIFKVDAEKGLHLKTGTRMAIVGTLQAIPNSNTHSSIITMNDVNDVQIYLSGQVIGERAAHIGQTGEWGMGISILKSSDIVVGGPGSISNCWGDGFYVWEGKNIYIKGITLNSNRRNNMSVISVDGLSVESCIFSDAHGTAPQAGIDMEPDFPVEFIKNVNIFNNKFINNKGCAILFGFGDVPRTNIQNINIHSNIYKNNKPISGIDPWYAKLGYATMRWCPNYNWWGYPRKVNEEQKF